MRTRHWMGLALLFGTIIAILRFEYTQMRDDLVRLRDIARQDATKLAQAVEKMRDDIGAFPDNKDVFALLLQSDPSILAAWRGPYIEVLPRDPWAGPYLLEIQDTVFTIRSRGPDQTAHTVDDICVKRSLQH